MEDAAPPCTRCLAYSPRVNGVFASSGRRCRPLQRGGAVTQGGSSMNRIFAALALAAGALGLWVLIVGPAIDPLGGGTPRTLSEAPVAYSAWAMGLLMGLV